MDRRTPIIGMAIAALAALVLIGCGSGTKGSGSTTTSTVTPTTTGAVLPPVILTPQMAIAQATTPVPPIRVGDTVVFSMGAIVQGQNVVATSSDSSRFLVTSKGTNNGTVTINAGGKAVAAGTVDVAVRSSGTGADAVLGTFRLVITD